MSESEIGADVWLLADDVASCRHTPPLQPTMKAILRVLYVKGEVSSSELYRLIPCSQEAIRGQLARLRRVGALERVLVEGRHTVVYRLSAGGLLSVKGWLEDVVRVARRLQRLTQAN